MKESAQELSKELSREKEKRLNRPSSPDFIRIHAENKIFSAIFIKENGEIRKMLCRLGVKKDLKGKHLNPSYLRNLTVWDMQKKGYRTIPTSRLLAIKLKGQLYLLEGAEEVLFTFFKRPPETSKIDDLT